MSGENDHVPGTCIVVMVVVVIRVVVVSSSMGNRDRGFLDLDRPAADEGCKAVVRSPGEIAIPVDSVGPRPGTACVGLVVVPAKCKALIQCDLQEASTYRLNVNASCTCSQVLLALQGCVDQVTWRVGVWRCRRWCLRLGSHKTHTWKKKKKKSLNSAVRQLSSEEISFKGAKIWSISICLWARWQNKDNYLRPGGPWWQPAPQRGVRTPSCETKRPAKVNSN